MKIGAIQNFRYANESKPQADPKTQNFKGIWMRIGQNYLDLDKYCAGAFFKFIDGKSLTVKTDKLGRQLLEFGDNGMTAKEGKQAWEFLFGGKETIDGCVAVQKLRDFMLTKFTGIKHNTMFLEKEDSALVTAERKPVTLTMVNAKLRQFASEHNLLPKTEETIVKNEQKILSTEEFSELIHRNGVA